MSDEEWRETFQEWRAPQPPADLEAKIWAAKSRSTFGLNWLLTGSVRVPVPALVLALIAVVALLISLRRPEPHAARQSGLAGFQPVKQFQPRVVGRDYAVQ
jgi:hypothetical protein